MDEGSEPLENLGAYLAQYACWGIDISLEDIAEDFGISREAAIEAVNLLVSGER
jgi:predicted DNA-binding protein YlxM (UPF0122 family)